MARAIGAMAWQMSGGGVALGEDQQDIEQRLGLALVRSVRKWTALYGEAEAPDRGWLVCALNFERQHFRRDIARHGRFFEELEEEWESADPVRCNGLAPWGDNPLWEQDRARAVDKLCEQLRAQDPDGFALLFARHGKEDLPTPIDHNTRSRLYRQRARARDFLAALGISGMEDVESHAPKRLPSPPSRSTHR